MRFRIGQAGATGARFDELTGQWAVAPERGSCDGLTGRYLTISTNGHMRDTYLAVCEFEAPAARLRSPLIFPGLRQDHGAALSARRSAWTTLRVGGGGGPCDPLTCAHANRSGQELVKEGQNRLG